MSVEQQREIAERIIRRTEEVLKAGHGEVVVKVADGKVVMLEHKIMERIDDRTVKLDNVMYELKKKT